MSTFVVGNIGRLEKQKSILFVRDFLEILKMNSDSYLILVGEGSLRNKLKAKAVELDIEKSKILGERNDIPELLSVMDVL